MKETEGQEEKKSSTLSSTKSEWGSQPEDNFGYETEEERRAHRGLEDWELLESMSGPQPGLFDWFHTVIGSVIGGVVIFIIVAYGLYYVLTHYGLSLLGKN